ncbi:hypothetical protein [Sphingomonas humi]|uniref:DUF2178 domain-containing protein n=1 Tax=Sphingomonas humi TaxID=335630 RepID=A0ABP7RQG5_9SPHN
MNDYAWGLVAGLVFGVLIVLIFKLRDRGTKRTPGEQAEYYEQRRLRMLPMILVIYLSQQAVYFSAAGGSRTVDHVKIGAWAVLTLVLMLMLVTRGFWFAPQAVREMIDDEATQMNRLLALRSGFIAAVGLSALVYTLVPVADLSVRQALHLVISLSLGIGLLHFVMLEKRAQRGLEA